MSKISAYNPQWEVTLPFSQYADRVSKGKENIHFTCKVYETNSLKRSNMGVEALKTYVRRNSKNGKKSKHERNMYVLKTSRKYFPKVINIQKML